MDLGFVEDMEIVMPVLDKKDEESFDLVRKMIEDGQLEQLKVDQCRVYLRKNGLRLGGSKDTLLERIKEHLYIINGGAEKKYPVSSFVLNCKGDACMGDVVMFKQNVYERFSVVSRSASGPPYGSRMIAGRIVKESYGASKQQHTFTIEVLWSKGVKALPPLYPLLIKGRNLYRMKTLRQRWKDEGEREKVLMEKHSRGYIARSDREARIERKEKWKKKLHSGATGKPKLNKKKRQSYPTKLGLAVDSGKSVQSPTRQKRSSYQDQQYAQVQRQNICPNTHGDRTRLATAFQRRDGYFANTHSYGIALRGMNHIPVVIPSQGGYHQWPQHGSILQAHRGDITIYECVNIMPKEDAISELTASFCMI